MSGWSERPAGGDGPEAMARTVLVTGGARGIGAAICQRLRADGWRIAALDRIEPEHDAIDLFHRVDVGDRAALDAALRQIVTDAGPLALVNNVGIVRPAPIETTSLDDLQDVMAVNVRTALICAQALLPTMRREGRGRIVNISSRTALGKELRTAYAASKAALHGLTRTWALELARHGITVNAVAPGTIATDEFHRNNPPDDPRTRAIVSAIPAGRVGTPDDIAQAVSFFLDARSAFVNGQVLYVCGGLTVGLAS
jgi:3-oxoacyl-[acyl-carrier protein] reductase